MIYQNYDELCRKTQQMPHDTDLLAFTQLYKRFGIECKINDCSAGFKIVFLTKLTRPASGYDPYTMNENIHGFSGCTTGILFDKEGKFLKQGLW